MDNTVSVTLFRHGVTCDNLAKKYVGWSDSPMTAESANRLRRIRSLLPDYDFYAGSDLTRCRQTADIIAPGTIGWTTKNLREMHFGDWELKTYNELRTNPDYRNWLDDPSTRRPPRGESFTEFEERVMSGWAEFRQHMQQTANQQTLMVTHGGVIRLLLTKLTSHKKSFWDWDVPHGKGIELTWSKQAWEVKNLCTSLQAVPIMEKADG